MPGAPSLPLSSTVSSVFDQFLKRLETENILNHGARTALAESLHGQKLDPDSLRKAIFQPDEPLQ